MIVSYDDPASSAAICEAVDKAGYGASPMAAKSGPSGAEARKAAEAAAREALEDRETPALRRRLMLMRQR